MAAIDFPNSPSSGDIFTTGGRSWKYDGSKWNLLPSTTGALMPTGGVGGQVFYENDQEVAADYGITPGKNAISAGPITINAGVTVTVPTGSTWTVV